MPRTPTNPLAHRSAGNWFQFFVPALLMTAMFVHFLPSFVVAGIAVACMAANGYVITRKPVLLRQMAGMAWLVGGTALALFAVETVGVDVQQGWAFVILCLAATGILIGFLSTLWHFATVPQASPTE